MTEKIGIPTSILIHFDVVRVPGKSIPASVRTTERPPSAPTMYFLIISLFNHLRSLWRRGVPMYFMSGVSLQVSNDTVYRISVALVLVHGITL